MRFLGVLVLLFAFTLPAYADSSVDWSSYVETNPARRLTKTTGPEKPIVAQAPAKAKPRANKAKKSHAKVKARAKRPSRR